MLKRHGLHAPSSHVRYQAIRTEWSRVLDEAAAVGQRYVVVPSIPGEERRSADDWKRVAALFNRGAEAAKQKGLQFVYHNHDFEFRPVGDTIGFDLLLAEADRKLVEIELDLYWITRGGGDPLAYFARWPGRFPMLHVKDMDGTPAKGFADLGRGTIDFARVFARAKQAGVRHYFYEQDTTPGSPFDSAKVGYDYLRNLRW
jgi:sugar phosphate isomerase/epimerase